MAVYRHEDPSQWTDEELLERVALLCSMVADSLEKQGVITVPEIFRTIEVNKKTFRMYHEDASVLSEIRKRITNGKKNEDRDI